VNALSGYGYATFYKYNELVPGFITKRSRTFGSIIPAIASPIFAEPTREVQDCANEHGFQEMLEISDYPYVNRPKT